VQILSSLLRSNDFFCSKKKKKYRVIKMFVRGERYRNTFLYTEKLEVEHFPCMCSYRYNFIGNTAVNKKKSDSYRKETTTVSGYTERPFSLENTL